MDKEKIIHAHWELAPEDTAYDNVWICSNCGEDFTQHRKPKRMTRDSESMGFRQNQKRIMRSCFMACTT